MRKQSLCCYKKSTEFALVVGLFADLNFVILLHKDYASIVVLIVNMFIIFYYQNYFWCAFTRQGAVINFNELKT